MKKQLLFAVAALLSSVTPVWAQTTSDNHLTVDFQLRTRGEYRNGQGALRSEGDRPGTFVNDRARLGITWENNGLSAKLSAQQTGTWGNGPTQTNDTKGLNVNEAWAKMKIAGDGFVQVGRQILNYDDQRLLGGLDWAATGRSFDALKFGFENQKNALHAIVSYNQNSEHKAGETSATGNHYTPAVASEPQHMEVLWYHANVNTLFNASVLFMNTGIQADQLSSDKNADGSYDVLEHQTNNTQTFGTYINGKVYGVSYDVSGYYQTGNKTKTRKISAYMFSANAKYTVTTPVTVGLGYDYLSGSANTDGKYKTFNNLYGTHHKFYGAMDILNGTPAQGLSDLNANVAYKFSKKVDLTAACHYFAINHPVTVDNEKRRLLGSEVDLQVNWKIRPSVTLQAGYSLFAATHLMEKIKGGQAGCWQDWGWISLNINPQIFKTVF